MSTTPRGRTVASARRTFAPGLGEQDPTCPSPTAPPMHVSNLNLSLHNAHGWEQALVFSSSISKQCRALSFQKGSEDLPVVHREMRTDPGGLQGDLLVGGRSVVSPRMTPFRPVQIWSKAKVCGFVAMHITVPWRKLFGHSRALAFP